jgi:hypothetical protein
MEDKELAFIAQSFKIDEPTKIFEPRTPGK